jgi:hypothetical protein
LSTLTPGKRYSLLTEPVSDWFVGGLVAQSLEPWHPPGVQTSQTLHAGIDFYYGLGALINFYSHTLSTGLGDAGQLVPDYITYSLNTNLHPRLWSANAASVYQWWLARSNAQISVACTTNGSQTIASFAIAGATDIKTSVELLIPGTNSVCAVLVFTNGTLASTNAYRLNGNVAKLLVGTTVTNAIISYYPVALSPVFSQSFDTVSAPALPAGWTSSATGVQSPWVTQTPGDGAPNSAFSTDPTYIGINELDSPPFSVPAGTAQLSFRNNYNLETGPGTDGFDGGVLEIKIGTNAFTDILTAGGTFATGAYNSIIDTHYRIRWRVGRLGAEILVGTLRRPLTSPLPHQAKRFSFAGVAVVMTAMAALAGGLTRFQSPHGLACAATAPATRHRAYPPKGIELSQR